MTMHQLKAERDAIKAREEAEIKAHRAARGKGVAAIAERRAIRDAYGARLAALDAKAS